MNWTRTLGITAPLLALAPVAGADPVGAGDETIFEDGIASDGTVGQNMLGGRVVDQTQVRFIAGYPRVGAAFRFQLGAVDLGPRLEFGYATGPVVGPLRMTAAADLRAAIASRGRWDVAFVGAVPLHLTFGGGVGSPGVGLGLAHPGIMATYNLADIVDLSFGGEFRPTLFFGDGGVAFTGAVPLTFAAEGDVDRTIQLGGQVAAGPSFGAVDRFGGPSGPVVGAYVEAVFEVGIALGRRAQALARRHDAR